MQIKKKFKEEHTRIEIDISASEIEKPCNFIQHIDYNCPRFLLLEFFAHFGYLVHM